MDENAIAKSGYAKAYAAVAKTDEGKALISKLYKGE
jgi:tRNA isopentenyl-2-thiomethyl-A-37 hydroxylase MiaE